MTDATSAPHAPASPASTSSDPTSSSANANVSPAVDLRWVWSEVRKRVFIKLPFSLGVADAMEAVVPVAFDGDNFVCGMSPRDFPLAAHLSNEAVHNTIESILRTAAGRPIHFEVIEGTSPDDWREIKERRRRAQDAVVAMAEKRDVAHHVEDMVNQIVSELRGRITGMRDKSLPQVRAGLVLDIAPILADAEDMLFADAETHESRRAVARLFDRVAGFLDIPALSLALEVERYRRAAKESEAQALASARTPEKAPEPEKASKPEAATQTEAAPVETSA